MNKMKKYLFLALAAAAVLVSCKREATPSAEPDNGEITGDRVPIQFSTNLLPAAQTKSQGALDQWFAGQELYIYGIARQGTGSTATETEKLALTDEGILINNVLATPLAETASFHLGEYNDVNYAPLPQPIEVLDPLANNSYFFYDEDHRYEFFGYFVDDAANGPYLQKKHEEADSLTVNGNKIPLPSIDEDGISLAVTINGAQDIMLATTDHDIDNVDGNGAMINPNRLYSAYSARRQIKPTLNFNHMLSRFNVYVKSGDGSTAANKKVKLTTASIETNDEGVAWIACADQFNKKPYLDTIHKGASIKNLATGVWEERPDPETGRQPFIGIWNDVHNAQLDVSSPANYDAIMTASWQKAGTVLVIPGKKEYMLKVGVKQLKKDVNPAQATEDDYSSEVVSYYPIRFEDITTSDKDRKYKDEPGNYGDWATYQTDETKLDNRAVKGHQYDVNVIVYGLQEVQIQVTMTEWDRNGSINMDPGHDYEYKIDLGIDPGQPGYSKTTPMELHVGDYYDITPDVTPALPDGVSIVYSSKKPEVASVDENGRVTALAADPEPVRIEVQVPADAKHPEGGFSAMYVKVIPALPTMTISVAEADAQGNIAKVIGADPFTLTSSAKDAEEHDIAGVEFTYAVTEGTSISYDGTEFTVEGAGVSTITVTGTKDGYQNGTKTITVTVSLKTMTITQADVNMKVGDAPVQLAPAANDNAGAVAGVVYSYEVKSQSATGVIALSDTGEITPSATVSGTAVVTITGTKDGYEVASKDVNVTVALKTMTITQADVDLLVNGAPAQLAPTANDNAGAVTGVTYTYQITSQTEAGVISLSETGEITPSETLTGSAVVTITGTKAGYEEAHKTVNVTVTNQ